MKLIIFDLGGVFVPENGQEIAVRVANAAGIPPQELIDFMNRHKAAISTGKLSLLQVYKRFSRTPKKLLRTHLDEYKRLCTAQDQEMIDLTMKLKKNYTVVSLTNTEKEVLAFNKKGTLFTHFHKPYNSVDMKLAKPDPAIYRKILAEFDCAPHDAVLIDDNADNIMGADRIGMHSIFFKDISQLRRELRKLKIAA